MEIIEENVSKQELKDNYIGKFIQGFLFRSFKAYNENKRTVYREGKRNSW